MDQVAFLWRGEICESVAGGRAGPSTPGHWGCDLSTSLPTYRGIPHAPAASTRSMGFDNAALTVNPRAMKAPSPTRSPLLAAPLRLPGQSLGEEIFDVSYDGVLAPLLLVVFVLVITGLEWARYAFSMKPSPWVYSVASALVVIYAAIRVRRTMKRLRDLKLGRDGERAVAQYLEWFRTAGFFVFHDVPNDGANIDHVLIGPRGIFTIETKTLSKPARGECKVRVAGGRVYSNGRPLTRDPLVQSKGQARWLNNFLSESKFLAPVQPVVVFPGWFVEPFDMKSAGVWVLEPKALDRFIEREPERFTKDQVKAMASSLSSFIRSKATL